MEPFVILIILGFWTRDSSSTPSHELQSIENNPGLYYERINTVQFKRPIWQVVIFLEVDSFLGAHGPTSTLARTEEKCRALLTEHECNLAFSSDLLRIRQAQLETLHAQIKEILETIGENKEELTKEPPNRLV